MLVHRRVTSSIKFAGTYLYSWVPERSTVIVSCPEEQDTMSQPGLEPGPFALESSALSNHDATVSTFVQS